MPLCPLQCVCIVSPGHSQLFNVMHTLKIWEWPGGEAIFYSCLNVSETHAWIYSLLLKISAPPSPIEIMGEDCLGELAKLVRLEVEFHNEFSNVLCVVTKCTLLGNGMKTATVKIDYDEKFIVSSLHTV